MTKCELMKMRPFIHLLKSPHGFYFYDVNRNEIVSTHFEIFELLHKILHASQEEAQELMMLPRIQHLIGMGYLSDRRPTEIRHPKTDYLEMLLENKMEKITLQLTQNCNFRCRYCTYSGYGEDRQRGHTNASMSYETAREAIDFFRDHSRYAPQLNIGFYGGEPLLEFDLLKKIVEYADETFEGRELSYNMTTNGSVFTEEIIEYCLEHDISVLVSLDGPREIHDRNRKLAATGQGTFDLVIRNIERIKKTHPAFLDKMSLSMVIDPTTDYDCYNKLYFDSDVVSKDMAQVSFVDTTLTGLDYSMTEIFAQRHAYDVFLSLLYQFDRIDKDHISPIALKSLERMQADIDGMQRTVALYSVMAPGGPCLPGVLRTLVDVHGNLFPCERCSETAEVMQVGSLSQGFDLEKAQYILNVGSITQENCKNCWAILHCTICASHVEEGTVLSKEKKLKKCSQIRRQVENKFLDMILLREVPHIYAQQTQGGTEENESKAV